LGHQQSVDFAYCFRGKVTIHITNSHIAYGWDESQSGKGKSKNASSGDPGSSLASNDIPIVVLVTILAIIALIFIVIFIVIWGSLWNLALTTMNAGEVHAWSEPIIFLWELISGHPCFSKLAAELIVLSSELLILVLKLKLYSFQVLNISLLFISALLGCDPVSDSLKNLSLLSIVKVGVVDLVINIPFVNIFQELAVLFFSLIAVLLGYLLAVLYDTSRVPIRWIIVIFVTKTPLLSWLITNDSERLVLVEVIFVSSCAYRVGEFVCGCIEKRRNITKFKSEVIVGFKVELGRSGEVVVILSSLLEWCFIIADKLAGYVFHFEGLFDTDVVVKITEGSECNLC